MWAAEADEQKTVFPKRIGFGSLLGTATGNSQTLILEINTCRIRISREKFIPPFPACKRCEAKIFEFE